MKDDELTKSEDFVQRLTSNSTKKSVVYLHFIHYLKQHAQVVVAEKAKFYDSRVTRGYQKEQVTSSLPLDGTYPVLSHISTEEKKNVRRK